MSPVGLHFKDGTTATISLGANVAPYPQDNEFVQVVNNATPPVVIAFVPVEALEWAEIDA